MRVYGIKLFVLVCVSFVWVDAYSQCAGLQADAGPDKLACDTKTTIQLEGMSGGTPIKIFWTPTDGLSDPNILDPFVTRPPGKYIYKLTVQALNNFNLINNGDFESGNSGFTNDYLFGLPGGSFGPGSYGVGNNPQAYNGAWTPCPDNTSGMGNMLCVDGSTASNQNVWCQSIATTPGKMYQFEMYVCSVYPTSPASLEVRANGAPFGTISAGSLCNWLRLEACFTATSAVTELCIVDNNTVGFGNDFAVDDIAVFEKCESTDEVMVEILDIKASVELPDPPKCSSQIFNLIGNLSSSGPYIRYEWSTLDGMIVGPTTTIDTRAQGPGTYTLKVIYENGSTICEKEISITVTVTNELEGLIEVDGVANCKKDTVKLIAHIDNGTGDYEIVWTSNNTIHRVIGDTLALVTSPGRYTAYIRDRKSNCQVILDEFVISDTLSPVSIIRGDSLINCIKLDAALNSTVSDTNQFRLTWQLPDSSKIINKQNIRSPQSGTYSLIVTQKATGCADTSNYLVQLDTSRPIFNIGNDLVIDCKTKQVSILPIVLNGNNLEYNWKLANGTTYKERTPIAKTDSVAGWVVLLVEDKNNGCSSIDSLQIIDNKKNPIITSTPDAVLTCKKPSVDLTANGSLGPNIQHRWLQTNGTLISQNIQILANQSGTIILEITDTSNACVSYDTILISENKIQPLAVSSADQLFKCSDSTLILTNVGSSSGSQYIYQWITSNGSIVGNTNQGQITINKPGIYSLIVTDTINGCSDTTLTNVNPDTNIPTASILAPGKLTCTIQSIDLSANASTSSGNPFSIEWTSTTGNILSGAQTLNPKIDKPGIYILTIIDQSNGCKHVEQVTVSIDTLKPISNAGTDLIWNCATTSLTLNGSASDPNASIQFMWTTQDGRINGNPNSKNSSCAAPGTYRITAINPQNGCRSFDEITVIPDLKKPIPEILLPDTLTCLINQINLESKNLNPEIVLYQWSTANGNIIGSNTNSSVNINKSGTYVVNLIDPKNNCSSKDTVVVIENRMLPQFSIDAPDQLTCKKKQITIHIKGLNSTASLLWTNQNGGILSTPTEDSVIVNKESWYVVEATDNRNGCTFKDSIFVSENKNIPTSFDLQITQPFCSGDPSLTRVSNTLGGVRPYTFTLDNQMSNQTGSFSNISSGFHTIRLEDANGCILVDTFTIATTDSILVTIQKEVIILKGTNYDLLPIVTSSGNIQSIQWYPITFLNCDTCIRPKAITVQHDIEYYITATSDNGCQSTDFIRIRVLEKNIWFPNSFSPNNDNINDWFFPEASLGTFKQVRNLSIYDRWGEKVFGRSNFQANEERSGWDGSFRNKALMPGVYVYAAEVEWIDGTTSKLSGDISLIK